MKAIAYDQAGLSIDDPKSLYDIELPLPQPGPHDLLVKIQAISVNPVDSKLRLSVPTAVPRVLGWDAGDITRAGSYAEYGLVDERIAGHRPSSIPAAHAAALPLTGITGWELLFDRLKIEQGTGNGQSLLIIGAGGGVGSILVQLARQLTELTIIGTASRQETKEWVSELGAHFVIDHREPLQPQLKVLGLNEVNHVISLTHTDTYYEQIIGLLKPEGNLALIDDPASLDAMPLKRKSISLHWEFMFTRSMYRTKAMLKQHQVLNRLAELIDAGMLKTTLGEHFGTINAENLRRAHGLIESVKSKGKIVLEGF
jgi:zinc-binding alcohol dehydrogenase family protein